MKKRLIVLPVVSFLLLTIVYFGFSMPSKIKPAPLNAVKGFALVELFTSEGCSSCPPADKALEALSKQHPSNVFVLAFHVDYWNYLGWKDEFSTAANTRRQQQYASTLQLNSIYTPQAIVNGTSEFTGSDETTLNNTVEKELEAPAANTVVLVAKKGAPHEVNISYQTDAGKNEVVCIALVQLEATSAVKRGENTGKLLHHVNVVRDFTSSGKNSGTVSLAIPGNLSANDLKIIAFVQNTTSMRITAAAATAIQ